MKIQMEHQVIGRLMLCCLIVLVGNIRAQTTETKCTLSVCTNQQGYIEYPNVHRLWLISKETQEVTTISLYLRTIQLTIQTPWLRISAYTPLFPFPQTFTISNAEERFYTFQASAVTVELLVGQQPVILEQFKINYFVGCPVMLGRSVSINQFSNGLRQTRTPILQTCWIVIPTLDQIPLSRLHINQLQSIFGNRIPASFFQSRQVLETYLTIQNVTGLNGSDIKINNLITGETLAIVEEDEVLTSVTSEKANVNVTIVNTDYSSIFLINFQCKNDALCQRSRFAVTSYGLGQEDLNCIEEHRCINNLGSNCSRNSTITVTNAATADRELSTTTCPAFNRITSDLKRALDFDEEPTDIFSRTISISTENAPKRLLRRIQRCNKHTELFCDEGCSHKRVKERRCTRLCTFYTKIQRGCSSPTDIFD